VFITVKCFSITNWRQAPPQTDREMNSCVYCWTHMCINRNTSKMTEGIWGNSLFWGSRIYTGENGEFYDKLGRVYRLWKSRNLAWYNK